ncbi:MAG TPA: long-chain fatty acid--CoA ligase [Flavobacteriaceae bacterium]|nr:long-chain fatty acid--CoA ligase [Flavobacteriaceae bacterium]
MENITRIFDIAYYQAENHPISEALATKRNGKWNVLSTQEYLDQANRMSRGLLKLGIKPNDKIGVITTANISEWNILDIGILQIGAQNVPIYPTNPPEAYKYILKHSEIKYMFVSDQEILDKVKAAREGSQIKEIYSFVDLDGCKSWREVLEMGDDETLQEEVEKLKENIKPEDLATLIYTSGTTGTPKGVMLSHKNIVSNVMDSATRVPFEVGTQKALSLLPVCHVFERMLIYLYQYFSISVYYAESIDAVADNLKEVKPTFMTVVPRVLEKAYASFYKKGNEMKGLKRQLFHWALNLAKRYQPFGKNSSFFMFKLKIARKLVLSKWKEGMGGNIELLVSGSSAMDADLGRIFSAAEMTTIEGYGLTETSPVVAVNTTEPELFKLGTVGKPIPHVEVKISEDGEILVKGPNVMKGYFKDDKQTKQAFTEDGYFKTGDIGKLDDDGFLIITDRKKQLFKTSGGKYIAPQRIELELMKSPFIEQVIVVGEGKKMPAALIQPDFSHVKSWANHKEINLEDDSMEGISRNEDIIARIQEDVEEVNQNLGRWEQVKTFRLTPKVWSIDGGELTPTLKVKRRNVIENYKDLYDSIYEE